MRSFMKMFLLFCLNLFLSTMFFMVYAQIATGEPTPEELKDLLGMIGQQKGTFGIVVLVTQGLFLLVRSKVGDFLGKWKLLTILLLGTASGLMGLVAFKGLPWIEALTHSTTLIAYQVLAHQLFKQFSKKE